MRKLRLCSNKPRPYGNRTCQKQALFFLPKPHCNIYCNSHFLPDLRHPSYRDPVLILCYRWTCFFSTTIASSVNHPPRKRRIIREKPCKTYIHYLPWRKSSLRNLLKEIRRTVGGCSNQPMCFVLPIRNPHSLRPIANSAYTDEHDSAINSRLSSPPDKYCGPLLFPPNRLQRFSDRTKSGHRFPVPYYDWIWCRAHSLSFWGVRQDLLSR